MCPTVCRSLSLLRRIGSHPQLVHSELCTLGVEDSMNNSSTGWRGFYVYNACEGGTGSSAGCLLLDRLVLDIGIKNRISCTVDLLNAAFRNFDPGGSTAPESVNCRGHCQHPCLRARFNNFCLILTLLAGLGLLRGRFFLGRRLPC